jgi:hypothetical protein
MRTKNPSPIFIWPRWEAYHPESDGWIYPAGRRIDDLTVTEKLDLPTYFAKVKLARGSEEFLSNLLSFYEIFGLLGRTNLEGKPRVATLDGKRKLYQADPLAWALDHAQNVDLILRLARYRRGELTELLNSIAEKQSQEVELSVQEKIVYRTKADFLIPTISPHWYVDLTLNVSEALSEHKEFEVSRLLIAEMLNPNLGGFARLYDPASGNYRIDFKALIHVIYWKLTDRLGGNSLRKCKCGALFFATSGHQRFCPPWPGTRESQCQKRFGMRKWRREERRKRKTG